MPQKLTCTLLDANQIEERGSLVSPERSNRIIITTRRLLEHWHGGSMTRNSALDRLYPEAHLELHEVDAARLGIREGEAVRVSSRRGAVVVRTEVSPKASPGIVFLPMHFAEATANLLTIDALDAETKIPEFKTCAVQIEIARQEELPNPTVRAKRGRY